MHSDLTETLYGYWQRVRDVVLGLVTRPAPMPVVTIPTDRHTLFEQLAALRERRAGEAEQHRHEDETLMARWREVQSAADALHHQLATMHHANLCRSLDHSAAEDALLRQIKAKSSMSLELFIAEVQGELDALNGIEESIMPRSDRNYVTMKKSLGIDSTGPSLKRRAKALHAARQRATEMQGELMTVEQLNGELIRLRRMIPAVTHETIHSELAAILVAR